MLRVLFFASIRERLGRRELALACRRGVHQHRRPGGTAGERIAGLRSALLLADKTIVAVNREVVTRDQALRDGDEIAFYPPVTGG